MTKKLVIILIMIGFSFTPNRAQTYQVCKNDTLVGVCDETGKTLIPQVYQEIYPCNSYPNLFLVKKNEKFGILDTKNKVVLSIEYECDLLNTNPFMVDGGLAYFESGNLLILQKNGKYGVLSADLKVIIPFIYTYIELFRNDASIVFVAKKDKSYLLIDEKEEKVSKSDYIDFASFYSFNQHPEQYAIFKTVDNKWIFVDATGNERAQALVKTNNGKDTIAEKIRPVRYNNKYAVFSYEGKLIAQGYDTMSDFISGYPDKTYSYSAVSVKNKYGILRNDGIEIIKPIYDYVDPVYFTGLVAKVVLKEKDGIVDLNTGKVIIQPLYDDIWIFGWQRGVTYARKSDKFALIDTKGVLVTDFIYDDIQTYQDSLFGARNGQKWGYINLKGKLVIPYQFDNTEGFYNETIIPLKKDGKFGYINKKGESLTPFKYDQAERFSNKEKAKIVFDGRNGWIDKNGVETWD